MDPQTRNYILQKQHAINTMLSIVTVDGDLCVGFIVNLGGVEDKHDTHKKLRSVLRSTTCQGVNVRQHPIMLVWKYTCQEQAQCLASSPAEKWHATLPTVAV